MKKLLLALLALVLVGLLFLPSRGGHTAGKLLTEEEAAAIAEPYFRENYGMEVE